MPTGVKICDQLKNELLGVATEQPGVCEREKQGDRHRQKETERDSESTEPGSSKKRKGNQENRIENVAGIQKLGI